MSIASPLFSVRLYFFGAGEEGCFGRCQREKVCLSKRIFNTTTGHRAFAWKGPSRWSLTGEMTAPHPRHFLPYSCFFVALIKALQSCLLQSSFEVLVPF